MQFLVSAPFTQYLPEKEIMDKQSYHTCLNCKDDAPTWAKSRDPKK